MQRLLYLVTEDRYFIGRRLRTAHAAQRAGYEIHVASRVDRHGPAIEAEGFVLHRISWQRASINPANFLTTMWQVRKLYRKLRPALVHHVSLQPAIVGSLAALGLPIACIHALTGLGYVFISTTAKARLTRGILGWFMPPLLNRPQLLPARGPIANRSTNVQAD